jgi:uncharacterized protein DUF3352
MSDLDPTRPVDPVGGPTTPETTPTSPAPDLEATTVTPVTPVATTPLTPGATTIASGPDASAGYPVEQPLEPGVAWAPAVPVKPSTAPSSGRGRRLRWAAAIAVVALVLGASAAVAALITNAASQATVLGYTPTDSVAYVEARLDLPGDQRLAVGEFLSHFPGFADQAALDSKLDEALDQVIHDATNGEQSYTTDIKPWFGGEIAFSVGPLPPAASLGGKDSSAAVARQFRALGLLSVTDAAKAQAYLDKLSAKTGEETTKQTYNGAQLTVYQAKDGPALAYAVIGGKVAALGDLASVKAAVDSNGNSGFASQPGPKAALAAADKDHVAFVYVALRPLLDWSTGLSKAVSGATGASGAAIPEPVSDTLLKTLPDWGSYWLRFEKDALVVEAAAPKPEISFASTDSRASTLVKHVPSSALVMAETNGLGATLGKVLDLYQGQAEYKPIVDQLDQALGVVGGRDAALGWIGDTAIVLNDTGGTPEGGLLIAPTDPDKAKSLLTSLGTLIGLGGAQNGITVKTEDHNGTTITIIDIADLGKLTGAAGGGVGAMPLPFDHVQLAYAVTNDVVVLGSSPDFVKHVLDTTDATSLANDARYKDLAGRVGTGTGQTFVDITAIRSLLEKVATSGNAAERQKYETDIKPFLEPFDALMASGTFKDDLGRSTVIVTVK